MKHSEVEEVKGFISATVDTYRPKYGRNIARFPRQCVFFGSTNNFEFLKDKTGNRRFLPLPINKSERNKDPFDELTDEYVNQIWAEAYQIYLQKEPLHIMDESVQQEAIKLQEQHTLDNGLKGFIEEYIDKEKLDKICARQVWHECLMKDGGLKGHDARDINEILEKIDGWARMPNARKFGRYGSQRGFRRIK